ncbi:MAG: polysulfide reductase NrfD [Chloroflexi bacterium]|nr:polysulfide reductase NrfD [Chloroflexota bacterium]
MNKRLAIILVLGLAVLGLGSIGMADRLANGQLNVGFGSPVPWALWVVFYIYFIGLSAGSFLISSLVYVFGIKRFEGVGRLAVFTALVSLLTALVFIWVDLGRMERVFLPFLRPSFSSPLAWIIWLYTSYLFLLLAEGWFLMRRDFAAARGNGIKDRIYRFLAFGTKENDGEGQKADLKVVRVLGAIGVPLAIAFHGGTGTVFAVNIARAYWYTGLFPIMFLVSALASGGALLTALAAFIVPNGYEKHKELVINLGKLLILLVALDALMEVAEILVSLYGTVPAHVIPIQQQLVGPNWYMFWVLGVGFALAVPLIVLTTIGRKSAFATGTAALISALGFVGIRWNIVLPGFAVEDLPGMGRSFFEPHWTYGFYAPSSMEWQVAGFGVGLALIIFAIGYSLLPLEAEAHQ